jgi:formylglycine-generating enzyme required for sulfatase activity
MTYAKQLSSAVALLASIAVLDNFIIVELEPGFESMVLIEPYGSPNTAETTQANWSPEALHGPKDFWIDQHIVNSAEFSKFLESTGYEPQEVAPHSQQVSTNQIVDVALAVSDEKLRAQVDDANWKRQGDSLSMNHTLVGQNDLRVSIKDAQTYCNWLGKVLPTAEQFKYAPKEHHDKNVSNLIEFRCVRNI